MQTVEVLQTTAPSVLNKAPKVCKRKVKIWKVKTEVGTRKRPVSVFDRLGPQRGSPAVLDDTIEVFDRFGHGWQARQCLVASNQRRQKRRSRHARSLQNAPPEVKTNCDFEHVTTDFETAEIDDAIEAQATEIVATPMDVEGDAFHQMQLG